jgi:predicted peptidase
MIYKKSIKVITFFTFFLLLISCGGSEEVFDDGVYLKTFAEVKEDFQQLTFSPGINDIEIIGRANFLWKFRLLVPANASPSNKRPLIISLHGGATIKNETLHKQTSCLAEPGLESLDAYILSPNSDGFLWFDEPNQNKVLDLTQLVTTYLNVNTSKVAITGYSDGGIASWFFAQFHPSAYSASIPMAALYNPQVSTVPSAKINIPMYVVHGEDDQYFPLVSVQNYVKTAEDAGTNIQLIIAPGLEHLQSCDYVPYLKDAATWLDTVIWQ